MNKPETIQTYIEMDIVPFIDELTNNKSFSEINGMIKLFDVEHNRLMQTREHLAKQFATVVPDTDEFQQVFNGYLCTWVLEQKIIDRRAIADHIKGIKGASNVMRPKVDSERSQELSDTLKACENTKAPRSSSKGRAKDYADMTSEELALEVINTKGKSRR